MQLCSRNCSLPFLLTLLAFLCFSFVDCGLHSAWSWPDRHPVTHPLHEGIKRVTRCAHPAHLWSCHCLYDPAKVFSAAIVCTYRNCLLFMKKRPKCGIFRFHLKVSLYGKYQRTTSKMIFCYHHNAFPHKIYHITVQ